jgi:hypothetical protein
MSENENTAKPIKSIGCANGWGRAEPPEFRKHLAETKSASHHVVSREISRCYHQTTCYTCGISWTVDSSD